MEVSRFSKNLIKEMIKCYKEENGIVINEETANEYLNSFAGLFLAFADKKPCQATDVAGRVFLVGRKTKK